LSEYVLIDCCNVTVDTHGLINTVGSKMSDNHTFFKTSFHTSTGSSIPKAKADEHRQHTAQLQHDFDSVKVASESSVNRRVLPVNEFMKIVQKELQEGKGVHHDVKFTNENSVLVFCVCPDDINRVRIIRFTICMIPFIYLLCCLYICL